MDAAFDEAQAAYDAAEPDDDEPESDSTAGELDRIVHHLATSGAIDASEDTHRLSDRQATVCLWIDGHEYSLTLNLED